MAVLILRGCEEDVYEISAGILDNRVAVIQLWVLTQVRIYLRPMDLYHAGSPWCCGLRNLVVHSEREREC